MNILIEQLPDAVLIDGKEVPIETDFRACLRAILAFEDDGLTSVEKAAVLLENLYLEPPGNPQAALDQALRFLNGGEDQDPDAPGGPRLYSFAQDARYIYAAFRQTHGVDLEAVEHMHWWKFLALFMDLGGDTAFCGLVGFRKRLKAGKLSKEERRAYLEMKDVVDLPERDTRTPEEKAQEDAFLRALEEGKRRRAAQAQG